MRVWTTISRTSDVFGERPKLIALFLAEPALMESMKVEVASDNSSPAFGCESQAVLSSERRSAQKFSTVIPSF
jgi:hypothetical protein